MPLDVQGARKRVEDYFSRGLTVTELIFAVSVFLVLCCNISFFRRLFEIYPPTWGKLPFLGSVFLALVCATALIFLILGARRALKPFLVAALLVSSVAAYFMDTFNVVIDVEMIRTVFQTNVAEASDLLSWKLAARFLLLGVLPSILVCKARIRRHDSLKAAFVSRLKVIAALVVVFIAMGIAFPANYYTFFRMHKRVQMYTNPGSWIFHTTEYVLDTLKPQRETTIVRPIGTDAAIPDWDTDRELIILVVGEAVRADRFSLNGYEKETNPLLAREDVISFSNFYSSGTMTSFSVPCMFSMYGRKEYSDKKGRETENLLDVLTHAGANVLWRENNSSSKGVADRVAYEDFRTPKGNPVCDVECRDEGMLSGLQEYIDGTKEGDILIVLHQMGNHGPAYYKRYPKRFEKFTPVCETSELADCTSEQIENAYNNAILYTDYFLSQVIELLKQNTGKFETAMFFVGDHGESLGESGVYLHGLPYMMAPDAQKHVPAIMWFGESFRIDTASLKAKADQPFSHDHLFHTVLGMMEIESEVYDKELDIISSNRIPSASANSR